MEETISAIDTITFRIPMDIWAPVLMTQEVPRKHMAISRAKILSNSVRAKYLPRKLRDSLLNEKAVFVPFV